MASNSSPIGQQIASTDLSPYPYAGRNQRPLNKDEFSHICGFLDHQTLARTERVCKSWIHVINTTDQWRKQCHRRLNIPSDMDPRLFLPVGLVSYKQGAQL